MKKAGQMAKGRPTTTSKIYEVFPVRDDRGDPHYHRGAEPRKPRELPEILQEPLPFNVTTWLEQWTGASDNFVTQMEFESRVVSQLQGNMEERWAALFKAYDIGGDSREDWKKFALALVRDHIPGLWVEHIYPKAPAPTARTPAVVKALVERVEAAHAELQASRTDNSSKVTKGMALDRVLKNWTADLGKKPKDIDSLRSRYLQCRAQYTTERLSLANLGASTEQTNK